MLQQFTEGTSKSMTVTPAVTETSVLQQLEGLKKLVSHWDEILREITQSVFGCIATTTIDGLPYYTEIPKNETDLTTPRARLAIDQKATLVYPQLQAAGLLFMRLRRTDPGTGEIEQFYVPVTNMGLDAGRAGTLLGIDKTDRAYFDHFHNPGETDPKIE
jgi:hypothetical protein